MDLLTDTFTSWAYPYVGLYHYRVQETGHKANKLFGKTRWSRIVRDSMLSALPFLYSLVIGGLSGCFAVLLECFEGQDLMSFV